MTIEIIHGTTTRTGEITLRSRGNGYDGAPATLYEVVDNHGRYYHSANFEAAKEIYLHRVSENLSNLIDDDRLANTDKTS